MVPRLGPALRVSYTRKEYLAIHVGGILLALLAALVLSRWRRPWLVGAFFAFLFLPAAFYNVLFHVGATLWFHAYCHGVVSALAVYPFVVHLLLARARRDGLLTGRDVVLSFVLAGPFHFLEVAKNVFHAW